MQIAQTSTINDVNAAASQNAATNQAAGQALAGATLDMNAFLTLFLTQLKYQDPTNPMQSYELASQLAQFSSVEQLTTANSNLVKLQSSIQALNNAQMVDLIGKRVTGQASTLQVTSGNVSTANYEIGSDGNVTIKIYDAQDSLVRTMNVGAQAAGKYQVNWDGLNDAGKKVSDGAYKAKVEAVDGKGNQLDVTTTISGVVYSFRLEQGSPYLVLDGPDGTKLPISEIVEVTPS
jgi:flagellar basal-body rod modification protein FlgD